MPPRIDLSFTLGQLIENYLETASSNQKLLSELSFDLVDQGLLDHGIHRQHLQRLAGDKVKEPDPMTLHVVATSLAVALQRNGLEEITADILYSHLYNTSRSRPASIETMDAELLDLASYVAAVLAPLRPDIRRAVYAGFRAFVGAFMKQAKDEQREARKLSRATKSNDV